MARKSVGHQKGQGQAVGRFKRADRKAATGPKSPGQRTKMPRGKMKINKKP